MSGEREEKVREGDSILVEKEKRKLERRRQHISGEREKEVGEKAVRQKEAAYEWKKRGGSQREGSEIE